MFLFKKSNLNPQNLEILTSSIANTVQTCDNEQYKVDPL